MNNQKQRVAYEYYHTHSLVLEEKFRRNDSVESWTTEIFLCGDRWDRTRQISNSQGPLSASWQNDIPFTIYARMDSWFWRVPDFSHTIFGKDNRQNEYRPYLYPPPKKKIVSESCTPGSCKYEIPFSKHWFHLSRESAPAFFSRISKKSRQETLLS